jgi:hypothetical protein
MAKLYRSAKHLHHWVACIEGTGWVVFPAKENGWEERKPARGLDPVHLREIPLQMAFKTGLPEAIQVWHDNEAA